MADVFFNYYLNILKQVSVCFCCFYQGICIYLLFERCFFQRVRFTAYQFPHEVHF